MASSSSKYDWLTLGQDHIWIPYSQAHITPPPLPVTKTDGTTITLTDGRELIDGMASWWSACHGYNHPHILQAMQAQLEIMPHVMFAGLSHEHAFKLATRLCNIAPEGMERVFFSDSGSVAVEVALKMVQQYWRNKGQTGKGKFLSFRHSYHGDTLGAMSVSDPYQSFHQAFKHQMTKHYVIDLPNDEYGFAEFSNLLDDIHKQLAGVIIEPLMQGAGGVKFHSADVLAEIHRITKAHNILFVTDEIATGFGRTGNMFACNEAGITPDIMTLSKAFTGGVIGGAATLATTEVYDAFLGDTLDKALMHGPTYMASPLMCAAANASLDLFEQEPRMEQVQTIETRIQDGLEPCREMNGVVDVRVKGAAAAVQLETEGLDIYVLRRMLIERGVWLRPFGDVIYLMPAFTIEEDALESLTKAVVDVTHAWSKGRS